MRQDVIIPVCLTTLFTFYKLLSYLYTNPPPSLDTTPCTADPPLVETDGASSAPSNLAKYGKPSFLTEIKKSGYHILYNTLTKSPVYVIERLTKDMLAVTVDREGIPFTKDESLTTAQSSANTDFAGWTEGILLQQFPQCNRGNWKVLENHARGVALEHGTVYVYSGPMYIPQSPPNHPTDRYTIYKVIGSNSVAVPTHFFKVLIIDRSSKSTVQCYITENSPLVKSSTVEDMRVSLGDVEKWSGLTFDKLHKFV